MSKVKSLTLLALGAFILTACGSARIKARKDERDKVATISHMYCDFVNGEVYPDVEVAMNLEMAKHCEAKGLLSITQYHSPSDATGLVYCCSTKDVSKEVTMDEHHGKSEKKPMAKPAKDSGKDLGSLDDNASPTTPPAETK